MGASVEDDGILLSVVSEGRAGRSYLLALDPPT
jgi:carotenoid cleavage dioxygenase-like enzyme